jgi:hypothetical protein
MENFDNDNRPLDRADSRVDEQEVRQAMLDLQQTGEADNLKILTDLAQGDEHDPRTVAAQELLKTRDYLAGIDDIAA